jgi:hypothetical protein
MADLLVIVLVLGFFGLCVAFVNGCDRIIGPDDEADFGTPETDTLDTSEIVAEVVR